MTTTYHAPTRPYSPIDALNRRAAAVGSPRYGQLAAHADYNGHYVTVRWNEYRGYYVAEYFWAGRVVLGRGEFATTVRAALDEHRRGALGSTVVISLREGDEEARLVAEALVADGQILAGEPSKNPEWMTWQHEAAAQSVRDYASPGSVVRQFDWNLMQAAESLEAYEAALKAKYGSAWVF